MQRGEPLEMQVWAAGANRSINLDTLPPRKRVRSFEFILNLTGTKDAADALSADLFAKAIKGIRLGAIVPNLKGIQLYQLNRVENGRTVQRGTDVPGSGTTFDITCVLALEWQNPHQPASDDGSLPCELFYGQAIEVTFDTAAVFGVGNLLITGGSLRTLADIVDETNTPQITQIGFMSPNSQTAQHDAGILQTLILLKPDGSAITTTDVANVDLSVDGRPVYNGIRHDQLVAAYNRKAAWQSGSNAELVPGASTVLPVVFQPRVNANLLKQPLIEVKGSSQLTGTLLNYEFVYRRAMPKNDTQIRDIAVKIGAPMGTKAYEPAFAKPSTGAADRVRASGVMDKKMAAAYAYLPGKMRTTETPLSQAVAAASPTT